MVFVVVVFLIILAVLLSRGVVLFVVVSFLMHPVQFVRDWRRGRREFDRNGYPRDGSP